MDNKKFKERIENIAEASRGIHITMAFLSLIFISIFAVEKRFPFDGDIILFDATE